MMKEKTTPKSVAPHKVKGAVLFTVVCVMMVLIVFLMGTLALAATANRRANINFQKEQTETIAKTVLTTVADAINADTSGDANGINAKVANAAGSPFDITVTIPGEPNPFTVSIKKVNNQRSVFDSATHKFVDCEMYELTTTVATNANNPASESTFSMYLSYGEGSNSTSTSSGGGTGGAFVASGSLTSKKIGTGGLTTGGTQIGLDGDGTETFEFDNTGKQESPVFINGNLKTSSGNAGAVVYFPGFGVNPQAEYFAVTGDFTINNPYNLAMDPAQVLPGKTYAWDDTAVKEWWEIPFLYVGGVFKTVSNQVRIGDGTAPVNVYCGSIQNNIDTIIRGDLYCFDSGATSTISGSGSESFKLQEWAERTYKNKNGTSITTKFGNIYSKGNLDFQKVPQAAGGGVPRYMVDGDIRCMGSVRFYGNTGSGDVIQVKGDIVAAEVKLEHNVTVICKSIYTDTLTNGGTILILQDDGTTRAFNESTDKHTYSAYSGSVYPVGFEESDILEMIAPPKVDLDSTDPDENVFADESEYPHTLEGYSTNFMNIMDSDGHVDLPKLKGDLKWGHQNGYWDASASTWVTGSFDDVAYIKSSCIWDGKTGGNENIYIDTTQAHGDITIYIQNSFSMDTGAAIVINDTAGDVNFYIPDGSQFNLAKGMIITTSYIEKVIGHAPSLEEIKNFKMSDLENIKGDMTINQYTTGWDYPKVFVYGEKGGKLNLGSSGDVFTTMNIRAPYVDVTINKGKELKTTGTGKLEYVENGITKDLSGNRFAVIGQIIAHDINVQNEFGLIYVTDSAGNGKTILPTIVGGGSYTSKVFRTMYYNFY